MTAGQAGQPDTEEGDQEQRPGGEDGQLPAQEPQQQHRQEAANLKQKMMWELTSIILMLVSYHRPHRQRGQHPGYRLL